MDDKARERVGDWAAKMIADRHDPSSVADIKAAYLALVSLPPLPTDLGERAIVNVLVSRPEYAGYTMGQLRMLLKAARIC